MKNEKQIFEYQETARKALDERNGDELYVIRSEMYALIEEEEQKPLDFHTDRYYMCAYLTCLDMYDLPKALKYALKIKEPTERVLRRIRIIREDIDTVESLYKGASHYLEIARHGTEEQLRDQLPHINPLLHLVRPTTYGKTFIMIQLLKAEGIIYYRLRDFENALKYFELARAENPAELEILFYHIKALQVLGNTERATFLIKYVQRLHLNEKQREVFVNHNIII